MAHKLYFYGICSFILFFSHQSSLQAQSSNKKEISKTLAAKDQKNEISLTLLEQFTHRLAQKVKQRLLSKNLSQQLKIHVSYDRSISAQRLKRFIIPEIVRSMQKQKIKIHPKSKSNIELNFSIKNSELWCVATLYSEKLASPSKLVVLSALDMEFEASIARIYKYEQHSSWQLKRLMSLPPGILDIILIDNNQELGDEIVTLSVDGIRQYKYINDSKSPQEYGQKKKLPKITRPWPNQILGRIAALNQQMLAFSTSANHHFAYQLENRTFYPLNPPLTAIQSSLSAKNPALFLLGDSENPLLRLGDQTFKSGSMQYIYGRKVIPILQKNLQQNTPFWPLLLRDVAQFEDRSYFLDQSGFLFKAEFQKKPKLVDRRQLGDRIFVLDLDQDGLEEIAVSSAQSSTFNDTLLLLQSEGTNTRVLFKSSLSGGHIVAFTAGDLNGDALPELLIVEEHARAPATLWLLEYRR